MLDLADDWAALIPRRRAQIESMYRQIGRQADAIVVVNPSMSQLFDREVTVVPNAVSREVLSTPPTAAASDELMVYVGTLSERFDSVLMREVMRRLPSWRLDLYGPCRYAGLQDEPSPDLARLLDESGGRVTLKGVVPRSRVSGAMDSAAVLVLPNEPRRSEGQDPMKLYDYAARARPIVATAFRMPVSRPPGMVQAASAEDFARAVSSRDLSVTGNREWAEANSWSARLPQWLEAVVG